MDHPLMRSVAASKRSLIQTPGHVIRAMASSLMQGDHQPVNRFNRIMQHKEGAGAALVGSIRPGTKNE
jgi:hypothetical protein